MRRSGASRSSLRHRIAFGEREISEDGLQRRLFERPELPPIDAIDPGFGSLTLIGCELSMPACRIDNLFIALHGLLPLVEAKL